PRLVRTVPLAGATVRRRHIRDVQERIRLLLRQGARGPHHQTHELIGGVRISARGPSRRHQVAVAPGRKIRRMEEFSVMAPAVAQAGPVIDGSDGRAGARGPDEREDAQRSHTLSISGHSRGWQGGDYLVSSNSASITSLLA